MTIFTNKSGNMVRIVAIYRVGGELPLMLPSTR
jgi:hypothetical protein